MLKSYFFLALLSTCFVFNSVGNAGRSFEEFEGDTLVIGSTQQNHPQRFTIDIEGGDLKVDGWDPKVIKTLPKNRFKQIFFENVGTTFSCVSWNQPSRRPGDRIAALYGEALCDGGEIRFQSYRFVLDYNQEYSGVRGAEIYQLIKDDPITIDTDGQIKFVNEKESAFRKIYTNNGKLENILSFSNPATLICQELQWGGFTDICVTVSPKEHSADSSQGLLATAKIKKGKS